MKLNVLNILVIFVQTISTSDNTNLSVIHQNTNNTSVESRGFFTDYLVQPVTNLFSGMYSGTKVIKVIKYII